MNENLYALTTVQLQDKLKTLNHAGTIATTVDSEGKVIKEEKHHYLGCTRCLIEWILADREKQ